MLCCSAGIHSCKKLREASLAVATCNFDRVDPHELAILSFKDYLEIISNNYLPSQNVSQAECLLNHLQKAHLFSAATLPFAGLQLPVDPPYQYVSHPNSASSFESES